MPKNSQSEASIRDYLAKNLDLVEPGLILIEKEKFLRGDKGVRGFIDIFARGANGELVVIEIKRSAAAGRQAIQELAKYAALLRRNILVKQTEYRLLVLSTDWRDLSAPFAEFVHATRYSCDGRLILLGTDGLPVQTQHIEIARPPQERRICRRHALWQFKSKSLARKAVPKLAAYMRSVGLRDFVLLVATLNRRDVEYPSTVYFAQQQLTLDGYMQIIERRFKKQEVKEFKDYLRTLPETEDRICEAADKSWEGTARGGYSPSDIGAGEMQIAHPEKAQGWLGREWTSDIEVLRYGRFVDKHISDNTIINEIKGLGGESFTTLDVRARVRSKPEMDALRSAINAVFFFNSYWRGALQDLCDYAQATNASSIHLQAYNTDDVLRAMAGLAIGYRGYWSGFGCTIQREKRKETFVGGLVWNGKRPSFQGLVKKHFHGDPFDYFWLCHFGEQRSINHDIMRDMGLEFVVFQLVKDKPISVRVQGASIIKVANQKLQLPGHFLEANTKFVETLVALFAQTESNFVELMQQAQDSG